MIKFKRINVMNFENAIRGMRNPLNSWDKSDSDFGVDPAYFGHYGPYIGPDDLKLAQSLVRAGSDHRKFMRQIFVSVDITAPFYWWKEFDTYKVGTVANSCSTMHTIHKAPLALTDFSIDDCTLEGFGEECDLTLTDLFYRRISDLEVLRKKYLETKDPKYWRALIQLLPSGFLQMRTVTLNYEVLRNIYHSRKNHKLSEWSEGFVGFIKSLPYAEELITI